MGAGAAARGQGGILDGGLSTVLAGLGLAAAVAAACALSGDSRASEAAAQAHAVTAQVHALHGTQPDYSAVSAADLVNAGGLPARWTRGAGTPGAAIVSPCGSSVTVGSSACGPMLGMTRHDNFLVRIQAVDARSCARLLSGFAIQGAVAVGTIVGTTFSGEASSPLAPAMAARYCAGAGPGTDVGLLMR